MALKRKGPSRLVQLAGQVKDQDLKLYELQERLHRSETVILRLAQALEARKVLSVVKLFRRLGASAELQQRAALALFSPSLSKPRARSRRGARRAARSAPKNSSRRRSSR
jgi:hypothetical protein